MQLNIEGNMATIKQKKAIRNIVENGGNVSKAMVDAGYSPKTAENPSKLTKANGFKELADKYLPDDMLLTALRDDIKAKKQNRKSELELAFKVKGKLSEKSDISGNLFVILPAEIATKNKLNDSITSPE